MQILLSIWFALFFLCGYEMIRSCLVAISPVETFSLVHSRLRKPAVIFFCLSFICAVWLSAIKKAQFAPHVITQSINGKLINQFTTTNPAYVSFTEDMALETNGLGLKRVAVTNYYWCQWSIFKSK